LEERGGSRDDNCMSLMDWFRDALLMGGTSTSGINFALVGASSDGGVPSHLRSSPQGTNKTAARPGCRADDDMLDWKEKIKANGRAIKATARRRLGELLTEE